MDFHESFPNELAIQCPLDLLFDRNWQYDACMLLISPPPLYFVTPHVFHRMPNPTVQGNSRTARDKFFPLK